MLDTVMVAICLLAVVFSAFCIRGFVGDLPQRRGKTR